MKQCLHQRGADVSEMGYWVCADCWEKLSDRPRRYGGVRGGDGPAQVIIWEAEEAASDGVTLAKFLRAMSRRYMRRARDLSKDDAYSAAIDFLKSMDDAYGDDAYDWSLAAARELADEDMSYWDADNGGSNQ